MVWSQDRWDAAKASGQMSDLARKAGNPGKWGLEVMNLIAYCEDEEQVWARAQERMKELQVGFESCLCVWISSKAKAIDKQSENSINKSMSHD